MQILVIQKVTFCFLILNIYEAITMTKTMKLKLSVVPIRVKLYHVSSEKYQQFQSKSFMVVWAIERGFEGRVNVFFVYFTRYIQIAVFNFIIRAIWPI